MVGNLDRVAGKEAGKGREVGFGMDEGRGVKETLRHFVTGSKLLNIAINFC